MRLFTLDLGQFLLGLRAFFRLKGDILVTGNSLANRIYSIEER